MSEVTRIFTVQITAIESGECDKLIPKEEAKEVLTEELKDWLDADDVVVTDVQDFVMEDTSCNGGKE